ncbi:MAG: hypothetical protein DVS81_07785 [Candidatus Accumulibacter meliphilus]|jgi:hypothetical protein|uniref:Phytanoyl-CoA dioxygenase n=1 Tax=Candidatus Accumulibacter meliphilus TaxID=2211374 RepID=A0A369XQE0_9PROT|nr:MAG: hypothetical protein DVS81_07785 [Candidatus Accumulibacter meliphilus]
MLAALVRRRRRTACRAASLVLRDPLMRALDVLKLPLHALALAGKTKSFVANPLIGSHWLNERGLHRQRVALADRSAWARRRQLGKVLGAGERDAYARDGFVVKRDFLPADLFSRLQAEAPAHVAAAREMRQGPVVTRRVALDRVDAAHLPNAVAAANDPRIDQLMRYVGAHDAVALMYLQTIIVDPARGVQDPQTVLHRDNFHSIAKAWLFLQDVGEDDGPFSYVPGSHRLTDACLGVRRVANSGVFGERISRPRFVSHAACRPRPARPGASAEGRRSGQYAGRCR